MKDLLSSVIESAGDSARALSDLGSTSPYIGSAIGALRAAQDNLNWELEAQARQLAAKAAAATPPAAGSTPAAKPHPKQ